MHAGGARVGRSSSAAELLLFIPAVRPVSVGFVTDAGVPRLIRVERAKAATARTTLEGLFVGAGRGARVAEAVEPAFDPAAAAATSATRRPGEWDV